MDKLLMLSGIVEKPILFLAYASLTAALTAGVIYFFYKADYNSGLKKPSFMYIVCAFVMSLNCLCLGTGFVTVLCVYPMLSLCSYTDDSIKKIYTSVCLVTGLLGMSLVLTGNYSAEELLKIVISYSIYEVFIFICLKVKAVASGDMVLLSSLALWLVYDGFDLAMLFIHFILCAACMLVFNFARLYKKESVAFSRYIMAGTYLSMVIKGGIICF